MPYKLNKRFRLFKTFLTDVHRIIVGISNGSAIELERITRNHGPVIDNYTETDLRRPDIATVSM